MQKNLLRALSTIILFLLVTISFFASLNFDRQNGVNFGFFSVEGAVIQKTPDLIDKFVFQMVDTIGLNQNFIAYVFAIDADGYVIEKPPIDGYLAIYSEDDNIATLNRVELSSEDFVQGSIPVIVIPNAVGSTRIILEYKERDFLSQNFRVIKTPVSSLFYNNLELKFRPNNSQILYPYLTSDPEEEINEEEPTPTPKPKPSSAPLQTPRVVKSPTPKPNTQTKNPSTQTKTTIATPRPVVKTTAKPVVKTASKTPKPSSLPTPTPKIELPPLSSTVKKIVKFPLPSIFATSKPLLKEEVKVISYEERVNRIIADAANDTASVGVDDNNLVAQLSLGIINGFDSDNKNYLKIALMIAITLILGITILQHLFFIKGISDAEIPVLKRKTADLKPIIPVVTSNNNLLRKNNLKKRERVFPFIVKKQNWLQKVWEKIFIPGGDEENIPVFKKKK